MSFPLPRSPKPFDITAEQSAEVKAALDTADEVTMDAIARDYPLEWDEWNDEVERGARPWVSVDIKP
jgi:hypothetical protein